MKTLSVIILSSVLALPALPAFAQNTSPATSSANNPGGMGKTATDKQSGKMIQGPGDDEQGTVSAGPNGKTQPPTEKGAMERSTTPAR